MKEELDWQPSAITNEEKHFLEEFARDTYSGFGEIVDLGCWMGSSTVSLAKGLSENKSSQTQNKKIHVYDWFRWASWMEEVVKGTYFENKYQTDDSFFEDFKTFSRPWSNRIIIHSEDLNNAKWIGENIELLSIDAMKDWELLHGILRTFFAYLHPNKSFIFHQDFAHWWSHGYIFCSFDCDHTSSLFTIFPIRQGWFFSVYKKYQKNC